MRPTAGGTSRVGGTTSSCTFGVLERLTARRCQLTHRQGLLPARTRAPLRHATVARVVTEPDAAKGPAGPNKASDASTSASTGGSALDWSAALGLPRQSIKSATPKQTATGPSTSSPPAGAAPAPSSSRKPADTSRKPASADSKGSLSNSSKGEQRVKVRDLRDAVKGAINLQPSWMDAMFGKGSSGETSSSNSSSKGLSSSWLQPQRSPSPDGSSVPQLEFADAKLPMQGFLTLRSQEEELALSAARTMDLPPLQSVLELTTAAAPPTRSLSETTAQEADTQTATSVQAVGRQMADGEGVLADGTKWKKVSGEDLGPQGYSKRWTLLQGVNAAGTLEWEECWWEASDWAGLRELGATKSGTSTAGGAWKEKWLEHACHDPDTLELTIERTAHKWARADGPEPDEWEEQWGEKHRALGQVNKYAEKWAKQGAEVWHEKWGEDYDGKGACRKYTDKWAERGVGGPGHEQWGDKWVETFGHGQGTKHGEVWSVAPDGDRYQRWWNEQHYGNGTVRKWGDSNKGENWDAVEHMDTYYNPVPHFGFHHALRHSPGLWKIPERRRDGKGLHDVTTSTSATGQGSSPGDFDASALGGGLDALDPGSGNSSSSAQDLLGVAHPVLSSSAAPATTAPAAAVHAEPKLQQGQQGPLQPSASGTDRPSTMPPTPSASEPSGLVLDADFAAAVLSAAAKQRKSPPPDSPVKGAQAAGARSQAAGGVQAATKDSAVVDSSTGSRDKGSSSGRPGGKWRQFANDPLPGGGGLSAGSSSQDEVTTTVANSKSKGEEASQGLDWAQAVLQSSKAKPVPPRSQPGRGGGSTGATMATQPATSGKASTKLASGADAL